MLLRCPQDLAASVQNLWERDTRPETRESLAPCLSRLGRGGCSSQEALLRLFYAGGPYYPGP